MPILINISFFAAGFIIGAIVVDRIHSKRRAAAREYRFEIGNPVDLSPTHDFRVWEGQ